jgi:hypothetical protein
MADESQAKDKMPTRTTEQRIADLELQLAQSRAAMPGGTLPDHSAGFGQEIEETWSQAEQEAARAEANG